MGRFRALITVVRRCGTVELDLPFSSSTIGKGGWVGCYFLILTKVQESLSPGMGVGRVSCLGFEMRKLRKYRYRKHLLAMTGILS